MLQDAAPRLSCFAGNRQPLVVAEHLFRNAICDVVRIIERGNNFTDSLDELRLQILWLGAEVFASIGVSVDTAALADGLHTRRTAMPNPRSLGYRRS